MDTLGHASNRTEDIQDVPQTLNDSHTLVDNSSGYLCELSIVSIVVELSSCDIYGTWLCQDPHLSSS